MNISKYIVECSDLNEQSMAKIKATVEESHFCLVRGLTNPEIVREGMNRVHRHIERNEDSPTTGERADQVRGKVFMKMSIGNARHGGVERPRFKRALYSPYGQNSFGLDPVFSQLARVRNFLAGKRADYALEVEEDGFWTASRMHHFPAGGGFMVLHRDTVLPAKLEENNFEGGYFQPLAILSKKGEDFETGGGVAVIDGTSVEYEDYTELGDIAIYDALSEHGVNDVDSHIPYTQRSGRGRYSGLATLYKSL